MKLPIRSLPVKEADTQKAVMDLLSAKHILHFRMNSGAMKGSHKGRNWFVRFGSPGMADILAFPQKLAAAALWIEIKSPIGEQNEAQRAFQKLVEAYGHEYLIVRRIEDFMEWSQGL